MQRYYICLKQQNHNAIMGTFIGILIGVIGIFGLIFVIANAENEHRNQERADKMEQGLKNQIKQLDDILADMNEANGKIAGEDVINLGNGKVKVKRTFLNSNFMEGAIMDEETFFAEEDEDGYVTMDESKFNLMQVKKDAYVSAKTRMTTTVTLNNKGIEQEKSGDEDGAIATYEECIKTGYPAHHAYDRLLVIYRRRKDYENEKRVCLLAIDTFKTIQKYQDRLSKIESLKKQG